jgi:hypothetical protein
VDVIERLEITVERRGRRELMGAGRVEQPQELSRRATSRHDDGWIAGAGLGRLTNESGNRVTETVQVLNANEARPAGCNHLI